MVIVHDARETVVHRNDAQLERVIDDVLKLLQQLETELSYALAGLAQPDVEAIAQRLGRDRYGGIDQVREHFSNSVFTRYLASADRVTILNTCIPNLDLLLDPLVAAVA